VTDEVRVTHPERVVFPEDGVTKGDVVGHYRRIGAKMLPHLQGRPLTLVRYPKGLGDEGFFQKNVGKHYPEALVGRMEMPRRNGVTVHPTVSSVAGIAYLANQGMIELHVPLARADDDFRPDRLVFDFDPPEDGGGRARRAAWACKALLDELGAASRPMATGSKGFHVTVRLAPTVSAARIARAAHELAGVLVHRHPDLLTHEMLKDERDGRVLVDWMRNGGGATVVAPWSLRARAGAPVATPLTWDELDQTAPNGVSMADAVDRPDPLRVLPATDPEHLATAAARLLDDAGVTLEHIDRFGRRR